MTRKEKLLFNTLSQKLINTEKQLFLTKESLIDILKGNRYNDPYWEPESIATRTLATLETMMKEA